MNRIVTSALGMLVIAGVLYRPPASDVGPTPQTQSPTPPRAITTRQQPGSTAQAGEVTTKPGPLGIRNNPCFDTSGPGEKIPEYFGEGNDQGVLDRFADDLKEAYNKGGGKLYGWQYMIATLADPVHTNLELYFDRGIEAIVRAASEGGYDFDRYWLPWSSEALPEEPNCYWRGLRDQSTKEKEQMPGLLLFRKLEPPEKAAGEKSKPPQLLFVFLVAETPTSGIDKEQFVSAVRNIRNIQKTVPPSATDAIRVLGPTFSGSANSLGLAVEAADRRLGKQFAFRVSSGSITNRDAVAGLQNQKEIRAGTTLADDCAALTGFNRFLQSEGRQRGEVASQVALISEDGTAYGEVSGRDGKQDHQPEAQCPPRGFLELHFPRKMAVLREAYQANPQVGAPGGSQQVSLPRRLLPLSLTESAQSEDDAVPVFSKQQTPIAQESQVMALASTLREKNIKYAGIMATDPLDIMFLIRFLHRSAPDVRLFTREPDLLFLRALDDDTAPLGLLAITSYPLLTGSHGWLSQGSGAEKGHLMVFTSQYAEATYNSCLLLLNEIKAQGSARAGDANGGTDGDCLRLLDEINAGTGVSVVDRGRYNSCLLSLTQIKASVRDADAGFFQPHQAVDLSLKPPLWLMMAGHSGYWPVRFLDEKGLNPVRSSLFFRSINLDREKLPRAWALVWGLVSCLALCHALAVIFAPCVRYRWLEPFKLAGEGKPREDAEKAFYLLVATLAVLAIEGLLLFAPWGLTLLKPWQVLSASLVTGLLLVLAASLLLVAAAGLRSVIMALSPRRISRSASWRLPGPFSSLKEKDEKGLFWYAVLVVFVVSAFCVIKPWSWGGVEAYTSFFWYRSIHLTSGVSPTVPFCFLLGALYVWAWTQLKCMATAAHRPRLWPSILLKLFTDAETRVQSSMEEFFFHLKITLVVVALTVFGFLGYDVRKHFATLESSLFNEVYTIGMALLFLLLFANWARLLLVWFHFRKVLEGIDQLPLRGAFRRLPRQYSWSPIWEHGGTRQGYEILIRWFDNLQKLASVTGDGRLRDYYEKNWGILQQIAGQLKPGRTRTALMDELQAGLRETTCFVEETYLRSEWSKGKSDSLAKEAQSSSTEQSRQQDFDANKNRILAEESLALYYLRYIRNVCLYMRYLVFFISAGFILVLISLKSYPFQSEHTISLAITAVFVVLGIGVIKVFVEMEKDPVLNCLADAKEGKLSGGFYLRLISYGALPLFTFIAAQFPSVARFFFSWIQPSLSALK
jgi:hypothetical protein